MAARKKDAAKPAAEGDRIETQGRPVIGQRKDVGLVVEVKGKSALIQNAFSQKAIEEMLAKHMGLSVQRQKKVPSEVIENAIIRNIKGDVCMPPTAFKAAMLTASAGLKTFERKKTLLKTNIFIEGQSVPIKYVKMEPRMDMVRTAGMNRAPDVRFRPQFIDWTACFSIVYNDAILDANSVIDLINRAGGVGVGEWRPERNGTFGTFDFSRVIELPAEIEEVRKACAIPLRTPVIPEWALNSEIDLSDLAKMVGGEHGDSPSSDEDDAAPAHANGSNGASASA